MNELKETFPINGEQSDTPENTSIFHDRYEGHFVRWLGAQGLALDASDAEISKAMEAHCDKHNTASITL